MTGYPFRFAARKIRDSDDVWQLEWMYLKGQETMKLLRDFYCIYNHEAVESQTFNRRRTIDIQEFKQEIVDLANSGIQTIQIIIVLRQKKPDL